MIRLVIILVALALLRAQNALVNRGAEVFRATCSVPYCHGAEGKAGRAPQLAARAFRPTNLFNIISNGKPGTGMPAFSGQLKSEDIEAVTQYVISLGSSEAALAPTKTATTALPPAAQRGRALFFDAVRMGGCGICHEVGDRGTSVGPDLKNLATVQVGNLRDGSRGRVATAHPGDEEPFPALIVEQTAERVRMYDLSSLLPVLRTFHAAQVRIAEGSAWSHAAVTRSYSDAELEVIAGYLTWVRAQPGK